MSNKTCSNYTDSLTEIIKEEKKYIDAKRKKLTYDCENSQNVLNPKIENLTGICFSGGGIRSATFNLGVIQGFTKNDKFEKFDYMSTVSGGGYIGSCLSSLLCNEGVDVDKKKSPFVG